MAELLNNEMRQLDPCPFCGGEAKLCKDVWPRETGHSWRRNHDKC